MKLTAFLLTAAFVHVYAAGLGQQVTLSGKSLTFRQIFNSIEAQTGYVVFSNKEILTSHERFSLQVEEMPLRDLLDTVLKHQPLEYVIQGKTIFVSPKQKREPVHLVFEGSRAAPPVKGVVRSADGTPLPGATVKVKGTSRGTTTGADGSFALKATEGEVIVVTYTGYKERELTIGKEDYIMIAMSLSDNKLDEVQIIAYGQTSRRLQTGSVSTVKSTDIERQPVTDPMLALKGRVPGMEIRQTSGLPGAKVEVLIRGRNSMSNGSEPLYIVDGVPYPSSLLRGIGEIIENGSPFNFINPGDIERIDVLKDADATAIYGSRGANGVILITTKKGQAGPARVHVNLQSGWSYMTRFMKMLNTKQYVEMRKEALANEGSPINATTAPDLVLWDTTRDVNWQKELLSGAAKFQDLQASVSGGNGQSHYLLGAKYSRQTTIFSDNFSDQKASVNVNLGAASPNRKFSVEFNGNYLVDNNRLPRRDPSSSLVGMPPNTPDLYKEDGSLNWDLGLFLNPFGQLQEKYSATNTNLIGNTTLSYFILPTLEFKTALGYNLMQNDEMVQSPASMVNPEWHSWFVRTSSFRKNSIKSWIIEPQLNYSLVWRATKMEFLAGATLQQRRDNGLNLFGEGYKSDEDLSNISAANIVRVENTAEELYKYNAIFGRINMNISEKLILNFTARRDGTSRFGPGKQFQNFGAIGAAWIFSEEPFIASHLPFLSFGKLRSSYGTTGSDQVGAYRYLDLYYRDTYAKPVLGQNGIRQNNLYNPDIAWELNRKFEAALELGFLQDKLMLSASFYQNRSSNQLIGYPLPSYTGFTNIDANRDATVQNRGLELMLNAGIVDRKNFSWNASFNISFNRNKLLSVDSDLLSSYQRNVGKSLGTAWPYKMLGVDPATGVYVFDDNTGHPTTRPDTLNWLETGVPIDLNPSFFGGLQQTFTYKNFTLDVMLRFVKQIASNFNFGNYPGAASYNQSVHVMNRWRKPGDIAAVQQFDNSYRLAQQHGFAVYSDRSFSDASFGRVENASLTWQMPESWASRLHMQSLKAFVQGQNLFTFSLYNGIDPETQGGWNGYRISPLRTITAGLQVAF